MINEKIEYCKCKNIPKGFKGNNCCYFCLKPLKKQEENNG